MLVLAAGTLQAGGLYTFRASGAEGETQGFATFNVFVNTPPSGGVCSVSPTSGATLSTEFTATCNGFADESSDTVTYLFGFVSNGPR